MAKKSAKQKSLVATLSSAALRRGTFGGQRGYLALPVALSILRRVRKATKKTEQTIGLEKLIAGRAILISALQPVTRRARKAAKQ